MWSLKTNSFNRFMEVIFIYFCCCCICFHKQNHHKQANQTSRKKKSVWRTDVKWDDLCRAIQRMRSRQHTISSGHLIRISQPSNTTIEFQNSTLTTNWATHLLLHKQRSISQSGDKNSSREKKTDWVIDWGRCRFGERPRPLWTSTNGSG